MHRRPSQHWGLKTTGSIQGVRGRRRSTVTGERFSQKNQKRKGEKREEFQVTKKGDDTATSPRPEKGNWPETEKEILTRENSKPTNAKQTDIKIKPPNKREKPTARKKLGAPQRIRLQKTTRRGTDKDGGQENFKKINGTGPVQTEGPARG